MENDWTKPDAYMDPRLAAAEVPMEARAQMPKPKPDVRSEGREAFDRMEELAVGLPKDAKEALDIIVTSMCIAATMPSAARSAMLVAAYSAAVDKLRPLLNK